MKIWIIVFVAILSLLFIDNTKAQDIRKPIAAYSKDSIWYVIDDKGSMMFSSAGVIEIFGYSEGLIRARISENGKPVWAFLNEKGEIVFKPNCIYIFDFSDGMALSAKYYMFAKSQQILGYYDKYGNEVIPHIYDDATEFSEGLAYVKNADINGFIDKSGNLKIKLDSVAGNPFTEGLAMVNNTEYKIGFIDKTGKLVIKYKFDDVIPFSEGKACVNVYGKFGYIDKQGKLKIKSLFDFASPFSEGRAFVGIPKDSTYKPFWAISDTVGNLLSEFVYTDKFEYSDGLAPVKKDKWGFVDKDNHTVIPFEYTFADRFKDGLAYASKKVEKLFGFIDKNGKYIIKIDNPDKIVDLRWNYKVK